MNLSIFCQQILRSLNGFHMSYHAQAISRSTCTLNAVKALHAQLSHMTACYVEQLSHLHPALQRTVAIRAYTETCCKLAVHVAQVHRAINNCKSSVKDREVREISKILVYLFRFPWFKLDKFLPKTVVVVSSGQKATELICLNNSDSSLIA